MKMWRLLAPAAALIALLGCEAAPDATPVGAASITPVGAAQAVRSVEALDGEFGCAPPHPRADDYAWICEGARGPLTATVQLFAPEVKGDIFGATLITQPHVDETRDEVAAATLALAQDLVHAVVPETWRDPAVDWIRAHMPEGGMTMNVSGAGITAGVEPLVGAQWYIQLYELDGRVR